MRFKTFGAVSVYHNGTIQEARILNRTPQGLQECEIEIKNPNEEMSSICLEITHQPGEYGGSAIPEPVKLECGKGSIASGDWSEMGVLKSYSGGMWYRKSVKLSKKMLARDLYLDLGEICATAEVHINGKQAGILMTKPFRMNI